MRKNRTAPTLFGRKGKMDTLIIETIFGDQKSMPAGKYHPTQLHQRCNSPRDLLFLYNGRILCETAYLSGVVRVCELRVSACPFNEGSNLIIDVFDAESSRVCRYVIGPSWKTEIIRPGQSLVSSKGKGWCNLPGVLLESSQRDVQAAVAYIPYMPTIHGFIYDELQEAWIVGEKGATAEEEDDGDGETGEEKRRCYFKATGKCSNRVFCLNEKGCVLSRVCERCLATYKWFSEKIPTVTKQKIPTVTKPEVYPKIGFGFEGWREFSCKSCPRVTWWPDDKAPDQCVICRVT